MIAYIRTARVRTHRARRARPARAAQRADSIISCWLEPATLVAARISWNTFLDSGVGYLTFTSIFARDYHELMAITMLTALIVLEICLPTWRMHRRSRDTVRLMLNSRRFCATIRPRRRPFIALILSPRCWDR